MVLGVIFGFSPVHGPVDDLADGAYRVQCSSGLPVDASGSDTKAARRPFRCGSKGPLMRGYVVKMSHPGLGGGS